MTQLGLLDNVGAPVIDNIFGLIVDTPANLALVEAIATSPAFLAINSAQFGVSQILGPFERALLVRFLILPCAVYVAVMQAFCYAQSGTILRCPAFVRKDT